MIPPPPWRLEIPLAARQPAMNAFEEYREILRK